MNNYYFSDFFKYLFFSNKRNVIRDGNYHQNMHYRTLVQIHSFHPIRGQLILILFLMYHVPNQVDRKLSDLSINKFLLPFKSKKKPIVLLISF